MWKDSSTSFSVAISQLVPGHKVTVKGLYIEDTDPQRINLTSVISVGEACG